MNNKTELDKKNAKLLFGLFGFFLYNLLKETRFFTNKYRIFSLYAVSFASFFIFLELLLSFIGYGTHDQKAIIAIILLTLSIVYGIWASVYFYDPD